MIASIDWVTLHQKFGFVLVVAAVLGALIGLHLAGDAVGRLRSQALPAPAAAGGGAQVVLGGALYLMGHRPAHELHYLYGAAMAVTLGVTFAVGRRTPWPLSKVPLVIGADRRRSCSRCSHSFPAERCGRSGRWQRRTVEHDHVEPRTHADQAGENRRAEDDDRKGIAQRSEAVVHQ